MKPNSTGAHQDAAKAENNHGETRPTGTRKGEVSKLIVGIIVYTTATYSVFKTLTSDDRCFGEEEEQEATAGAKEREGDYTSL